MKKMIIALMLVMLVVFAVACGTDTRKDNAELTPSADVMPQKTDDQNLNNNNNNTGNDPTINGDVVPDNGVGGNVENSGSVGDNGAPGTVEPDATVMPELVPSEEPQAGASAVPNENNVKK